MVRKLRVIGYKTLLDRFCTNLGDIDTGTIIFNIDYDISTLPINTDQDSPAFIFTKRFPFFWHFDAMGDRIT